MSLSAGKRAYPFDERFNDRQPLANLRLTQLGARALALNVGAKRDPMNFSLEYLPYEVLKVLGGERCGIESRQ